MTMTDVFDRFEGSIGSWISRHAAGLVILGLFIALWICISIAVVSYWGLIGAANFEYLITSHHNGEEITAYNGTMSNETYDIMKNVIIPASMPMFDTMGWLMLIICGAFVVFMGYVLVRGISRRYSDHRDN